MAFYNLKKKPALTTKEGETETMYADIVYSGTIPAERLIRGVAKRTGFKEGVIEGILMYCNIWVKDTASNWESSASFQPK